MVRRGAKMPPRGSDRRRAEAYRETETLQQATDRLRAAGVYCACQRWQDLATAFLRRCETCGGARPA